MLDDSPAQRAGLRVGDVIFELDGAPTESAADLQRLMVAELIGKRVEVVAIRGSRTLRLEIVPAELQDGPGR